ncbi:unnamed protein product, partial [Oikopleura dioica]
TGASGLIAADKRASDLGSAAVDLSGLITQAHKKGPRRGIAVR